MRKRLGNARAAVLAFALLCLSCAPAQVFAQSDRSGNTDNAANADKPSQIDDLMKVYHGYRHFNGAVLVAAGGKVIHKKGYGLANMEWNIPVEPDTRFRLGSITKQFTAMLVLQLAQDGKIKLDGKISEYLPDYRKDMGDRITVHQLLNHTSGIPSYTDLPRFFADVSRDPYEVGDFIKRHASGDLEFEPGAKFTYSNSGYFLLGAIIERVAGKPYEQVLKERIFDPVGMKGTGYDHHDTILPKRAAGYEKTHAGFTNAPYLDMSIPYAAGSLYSTVEDLYLWDQTLYTDKLLSPQYKELMFKPNLENYAYGWSRSMMKLSGGREVEVIHHSGGINGFNTRIVRMPETKHLIVLLNNTGGTKLPEITRNIAAILYGLPHPPPLRDIAEALLQIILKRDVSAAIKQYRALKSAQAAAYDFSEPQLNRLGYHLIELTRMRDAIEIFKLNVEMFPNGANTYDSLGEAYAKNGDKDLAIQNYRKSLELNPKNTGATDALKKLEAK